MNVREWSDWGRIKSGGHFIVSSSKRIFIFTPVRPVESFEDAQRRMKLTNHDLDIRARALYRLSMMMACLSLLLLGYTLYHVFYGTLQSALLTLALTMLSTAMAFRYHFWHFQIKMRQLGCSFSVWFRQGLLGEKS